MNIHTIKKPLQIFRKILKGNPDRFLNQVSGVVHIGANSGQEREIYKKYGNRVIWIEPIPEVFAQLEVNIQGFDNQLAIQALVTNVNNQEHDFHITSKAASSSLMPLKDHKGIWPEITHKETVRIKGITLPGLFEREQIDANNYQALIMDTQGSELLILESAMPILDHFKFIKVEVADFEAYEGCCQLTDISNFMTENGYSEFSRNVLIKHKEVGSYFDLIYIKKKG